MKGIEALNPTELLAYCKAQNVQAIDLRFMDFPGLWQHTTYPVGAFSEDTFEEGLGFDGSSIRGWQNIDESDMLLMASSRIQRSSIHLPRFRP